MIAARLALGLPPGVGLGLHALGTQAPPLWPGETTAMRHAVPRRQAEFRAGRAAARRAMAAAGLPLAAIPAGRDRAPLWPAGTVGSITHGGDFALALAAPAARFAGLGIDAEPALPLSPDVAALIVSARDRLEGAGLPACLAPTLGFSAKEAVFKAQFPLTGRWLEFHDVAVTLGGADFTATCGAVTLCGRWARVGGLFVSWLVLGAEQLGQLDRFGRGIVAGQCPTACDPTHPGQPG